MPNRRNGTKRGFEPGLTRLRVRRSTTELPRSTTTDLRKAEDEDKWREKANNRDQWYFLFLHNYTYSGVTTRPASPLQKGNPRKNNSTSFYAHCKYTASILKMKETVY